MHKLCMQLQRLWHRSRLYVGPALEMKACAACQTAETFTSNALSSCIAVDMKCSKLCNTLCVAILHHAGQHKVHNAALAMYCRPLPHKASKYAYRDIYIYGYIDIPVLQRRQQGALKKSNFHQGCCKQYLRQQAWQQPQRGAAAAVGGGGRGQDGGSPAVQPAGTSLTLETIQIFTRTTEQQEAAVQA